MKTDYIYVLLMQLATLCFVKLFFDRFWEDSRTKMGRIAGVVLYMTYPYRIYVCVNQYNFRENIVWMLFPLYGWAVLGLLRKKSSLLRDFVMAAVTLAGIGYADSRMFFITIGIVFLMMVYGKTLRPTIATMGSCLLFAPGIFRLVKYLFTDEYLEWGISLQSIMPKGYRVGQFLGTYAFREEHPGIGLGMIVCLVLGLWLRLVQGEKETDPKKRKELTFTVGVAVLLLFFSTRYCPWDFVQRLGSPFLRLIGMFETPVAFFGYACALLCIPAADSVRKLEKREDRTLSFAIPMLTVALCIGICLYQCGSNIL